MIYQVMVVYDSKVRAYFPPFFVPTIEVGIRAFSGSANQAGHQMCNHPEDFSLHHIGEWNDESAYFKPMQVPVNLGLAAQYKQQRVSNVSKVDSEVSNAKAQGQS